jgi:hypothetical protein
MPLSFPGVKQFWKRSNIRINVVIDFKLNTLYTAVYVMSMARMFGYKADNFLCWMLFHKKK